MSEDIATVVSEVVGKRLVGELLTIADAVSGDRTQRDAVKSLIRQSCQKALHDLSSRLIPEEGKATDKKVEKT